MSEDIWDQLSKDIFAAARRRVFKIVDNQDDATKALAVGLGIIAGTGEYHFPDAEKISWTPVIVVTGAAAVVVSGASLVLAFGQAKIDVTDGTRSMLVDKPRPS